jgi:hypothetical protein
MSPTAPQCACGALGGRRADDKNDVVKSSFCKEEFRALESATDQANTVHFRLVDNYLTIEYRLVYNVLAYDKQGKNSGINR